MAVLHYKKYEELTIETAIAYAKQHQLIDEHGLVQAEEIGDGNLNYVFRIQDNVGNRIILKQALPYAKVIGASWPLTLHRAVIEANTLQKHGEFVPHLVPKVFKSDAELAITVMEDLSHLTIARQGLVAGENYPLLAKDLAEYLAKTSFGTSVFGLHPFEKKKLQAEFSNPELCKITEELIFTDPYNDSETNNFEEGLTEAVQMIWANEVLKLEVAKIKYSFLTEAESLLHGDLHTGSVFVSANETKVIDPEFAFYGPIGFDVGQVIANFLFQYITRTGEAKQFIREQIKTVWNDFEKNFAQLWQTKDETGYATIPGYYEATIAKIFKDSLGFAGTELIRRTIGLAHVIDLDSIEDEQVRITKKLHTLAAGEQLILQRSTITTIEQLLYIVEELQ